MFRGYCTFVCDDCKTRFTAMDIEYACTTYSAPMKCPGCGSMHTYPKRPFLLSFLGLDKRVYKSIWKRMDEKTK